ncbi:PQQ-binding-like beta-propeller repeat protein [Candidatus Poribacteria bacterium]|nr:PQQ-binding-like beta-propeller repeat protein [Candidatus Poribacteria bacterium]
MTMENRVYVLLRSCAAVLFGAWYLVGAALTADTDEHSIAEWAQWRGPNRDGISSETGFLKNWSKEGPKVLWHIPFGDGYSGISIAQGKVYTMSAEGDAEFVICLDASNGEEIWRFRSGAKFTESRGDGPRSMPTVHGDSVFALGAEGKLYALNAHDGTKLWSHNFVKEFGSKIPTWGFSSSPLIEGNLVLVEAGGKDGKSIVAFDKKSGDVVWTTHTDPVGYSSPIAIDFGGVRQMIFLTSKTLLSLAPENGHIYWKYAWPEGINIATPIFIPDDKIFISASYDKGAVLLKMTADEDGIGIEEVWKSRVMKNHFNSSVLQGDYLYGFDNAILTCIEVNTGEEQWQQRGFEKGSLLLADGYLIILGEKGKLALVEANPSEYREKALFQLFDDKCWTVPTLAGGKLYLRNQKEMVCLDLR